MKASAYTRIAATAARLVCAIAWAGKRGSNISG